MQTSLASITRKLQNRIAKVAQGRALAALFDQALVSGANFLPNILLARGLGLREYGVFALSWMVVLFANSLQYAFVITPMVSIGPKQDSSEKPAYYGAVLVQELLFAALATVLVLAGVLASAHFCPAWNARGLALPLAGATFAYLLQDFLRRYFFSTGQSGAALRSDALSYLTQLPFLALMARNPHISIGRMLWVISATSLAGFVACARKYGPVRFSRPSAVDVLRRHWRMSRWLAPSALMSWGAGNLFLMAAPVYYGAPAAAALRAAQNIVAVAHIWYLGLDNIVPAEAARQVHRGGVEALLRYIQSVMRSWGGLTLAFALCIAAAPEFWLRLAYGEKYASYGAILRLYALLYFVIFLSGPLRAGLQALEYTAPIFWSYPFLIAFSITLAGPFSRQLGLRGSLFGMIAVNLLFQGMIASAFIRRVRRLNRRPLAMSAAAHNLS